MNPDFKLVPVGNTFAKVSPEDFELVSAYKWHIFRHGRCLYARGREPPALGRRSILMHRKILGLTAPSPEVDHRDGDGLNNTRENLRLASRRENGRNCRKPVSNTSGLKGVCWHKRASKWMASIRKDNKAHYLGLFDSPEEAHAAYCSAAEKLHKEFANYGDPA